MNRKELNLQLYQHKILMRGDWHGYLATLTITALPLLENINYYNQHCLWLNLQKFTRNPNLITVYNCSKEKEKFIPVVDTCTVPLCEELKDFHLDFECYGC